MTELDLQKLSLDDLKVLKREVEVAIASFDERKRQFALAAVDTKARELGFTLKDLIGGPAQFGAKRAAAAAKYRHPENPAVTWSGRGRRPLWFRAHVEGGKSADDLRM